MQVSIVFPQRAHRSDLYSSCTDCGVVALNLVQVISSRTGFNATMQAALFDYSTRWQSNDIAAAAR